MPRARKNGIFVEIIEGPDDFDFETAFESIKKRSGQFTSDIPFKVRIRGKSTDINVRFSMRMVYEKGHLIKGKFQIKGDSLGYRPFNGFYGQLSDGALSKGYMYI